MPLQGPRPEDTQKLNAEVNQLVNQRLALTTLAVTIFGAVVAWLIPQDSSAAGAEVGVFRYSVSVLLTIFLFTLFLLTHHLSSMLRIITTYLAVSDASGWEKDWAEYRKRFPKYLGYTKPQSVIFLMLGVLSAGFPFLIFMAFPISIEPLAGAVVSAILLCSYLIFVAGMGFAGWFTRVKDLKRRWEEI